MHNTTHMHELIAQYITISFFCFFLHIINCHSRPISITSFSYQIFTVSMAMSYVKFKFCYGHFYKVKCDYSLKFCAPRIERQSLWICEVFLWCIYYLSLTRFVSSWLRIKVLICLKKKTHNLVKRVRRKELKTTTFILLFIFYKS